MLELSSSTMQSAPASVFDRNTAIAPSANVIAQAVAQAQGVQDLSNGVVYDIFTIPTSFTVTTTSNNGGGAATATQYLFNTSNLNAADTDNGSGAASMTTTYGDGFSGHVYDQYLRSANNGRGVLIVGFTVIATNYTSGAQISSAFNTLSLNLISANGQGSTIPVPIDVAEAIRNTQYQSGTLTVGKKFYLNAISQLQYSHPANTSFSWTFFTSASGFKG